MKSVVTALVAWSSIALAQHSYPGSRVCFSYAAEVITYHVTENIGYASAVGAMPGPSPIMLNYIEVGYWSYNKELMIGINGGLSLGQPNNPLRFTKAALDIELGLSGGSIDIYAGLKGFVLLNIRQRGVSSFNLSEVNVSYTEGQFFGYAVEAGIRTYVGSFLLIYAEGSLNIYPGGRTLTQWYNAAAIAPFETVTLEPFSLKGGIGITF